MVMDDIVRPRAVDGHGRRCRRIDPKMAGNHGRR